MSTVMTTDTIRPAPEDGLSAAQDAEPRLTVLQVITPKRYSGAERAMTYLSEALVRRGHRVVVACKHNDLMLDELRARGVEAEVLRIRGKFNVAAPFRIGRYAKAIGADIIHTHLSTAGLWGSLGAKVAGVPCLGHVHWLNRKHWYVFADHIATCSEAAKRHLVGQGMDERRIAVIYNGLDTEQFVRAPEAEQVRAELGLEPGQPVIGAVAHISPHKGHRYLVQAMARLVTRRPDTCCLIIGEGRDETGIREMIGQLGLQNNIRMLGYRHDAVNLLKAVDVAVLPSLREGLGIALIEAGFLGKPTVASDIPGIDEVIINGETGLLVRPADPEALAQAIESLLDDREAAARMGLCARERMERLFTLDAMADATVAVYRAVIQQYYGRVKQSRRRG